MCLRHVSMPYLLKMLLKTVRVSVFVGAIYWCEVMLCMYFDAYEVDISMILLAKGDDGEIIALHHILRYKGCHYPTYNYNFLCLIID